MANNELLSMGLVIVFTFFMVPFVLFLAYTGAAADDEHGRLACRKQLSLEEWRVSEY